MKILFLASGNGGTLKFVHQAVRELNFKAEIVAVISDRDCGAIEYAERNDIPNRVFKPWREETEEIITEIRKWTPHIVITNIHKILPIEIFSCCNAQFINLHYSLLPSFGGVIGFKTLELARAANTRIIGATCHYVTKDLDGGKVISQAAIPVDWEKESETIGNRMFRIACETILNGILLISGNVIGSSSISDVIYSPELKYDNSKFTESFWNMIGKL